MQTTEKKLFERFEKLAKSVRLDFKKKGIIIPVQEKDGKIRVGEYVIDKKNTVYYISNKRGAVIIGPLNLAQTAVVVANDLALGRWPDHTLLDNDQWYGYKMFAELSAIHVAECASKKNDPDRADFSRYKATIACEQKLSYKKAIDSRFNKLCNLT